MVCRPGKLIKEKKKKVLCGFKTLFRSPVFVFKTGVHLKAVFPPLNLGLMRISRSHFKESKFLGDFGGFLGRDRFSQRISKISRNKKC